MFMMRFDMRAPEGGASTTDLYAAAIEMSAWGETRGCIAAVISEHHASSDGYLPSPLLLASAIAARTDHLFITIAAALLPFYDPIRFAEDINVLDIISNGRVSYICGIGYRAEEFEQFGLDMKRARSHRRGEARRCCSRRARVSRSSTTAGASTSHRHRSTPGGPSLSWGGGSIAAAKRAGRYGLDFMAQSDLAGMKEAYEAECRAHGREPGNTMLPGQDSPSTTFVADDVDQAWDEVGSYLLHDAKMYAAWNPGDQTTANISHATDGRRAARRRRRPTRSTAPTRPSRSCATAGSSC